MSEPRPSRPLQIFLGYAPEDQPSRHALEKHIAVLQRGGQVQSWHEGSITPGKNRKQEIVSRMQEADLILLLISADFIASDFCYEVHLEQALHRHRAGDAIVLPIIVRPVDWQETPFGNLQVLPGGGQPISAHPDIEAAWQKVATTLRQIVEQLRRPTALSLRSTSTPPPEPPGGGYSPRWYVRRPKAEQDALTHLLSPGTPAVLFGPELIGKTLTLCYLLSQLNAPRESGSGTTAGPEPKTRVIEIDLRQFDPAAWASLDSFLFEFASCLLHAVGAPTSTLHAAWRGILAPTQKLSRLMENHILPCASGGRLVLAIDHADVVCERTPPDSTLPDSFFGLLRVWIDRSRTRSAGLWPSLRLLLAIATSPAYLVRNLNQSPFNICLPIDLQDLEPDQVIEMIHGHGMSADVESVGELSSQVKGHPYLIRVALYKAAMESRSLYDLLHERRKCGLFDDFLLRVRGRLQRARLYEAAHLLYRDPHAAIPPETYHLLQRAGIVMRHQDFVGSFYSLRYSIYARMFHL